MGCCSSTDSTPEGGGDIDALYLEPETPIKRVFAAICKCCGITDESLTTKYIQQLNELWYCRAIDLLNVEKATWAELKMPLILNNHMMKFIENCRQNASYQQSQQFKDDINIKVVLEYLRTNNPLESASNDLNILAETFTKLYVLRIDKLKLYLTQSHWNDIKVAPYLKSLLLQLINHQFEGECDPLLSPQDLDEKNEGETGEDNALFPDLQQARRDINEITRGDFKIDSNENNRFEATLTLNEICDLLSTELLVESDQIRNDLSSLYDYNYNRLYHLSMISDDLYHKLLDHLPNCLKSYLFDIITNVRSHNTDSLPFYIYNDVSSRKKRRKSTIKLKAIDISATMRTDHVFSLLEKDMNLEKGELDPDCDILMNHFYSNLWDLLFVPDDIWRSLPIYNNYEIVRIRMNDLMQEIVDSNKTLPALPKVWIEKYCKNTSIEQVFFGGNKKEFTFDGLDWSQDTANKMKFIVDYLHSNFIGKLPLISEEHANNNETWTKYMNDHQISPHIRFKIMFYSSRANIQTSDVWLNEYINKYYGSLPPQYAQEILPQTASFIVEDIGLKTALLRFIISGNIKADHECFIEILNEDEKESKWNNLGTITAKQETYLCNNLESNTLYKTRARYKYHSKFGKYSQIQSFTTTKLWFDDTTILTREEAATLTDIVNKHTKYIYDIGWRLLYRGSRDGFTRNAFYAKCHNVNNTLCIIRTDSNNVFGGFTTAKWNKNAPDGSYTADANAFLYLIRSSKNQKAQIFAIQSGKGENAIRQYSGCFLMFGGGGDGFYLSDHCNQSGNYSYSGQSPRYGVPSSGYLNGGTIHFKVVDVELYRL